MEISLSEVLKILFKRAWILIICVVVFTAGAFVITNYLIDKKYTSSVSLYVQLNKEDSEKMVSLNELYYAKEVVSTYMEILRTDSFMKNVTEESGLSYSASELKNLTTISSVNKTEIFKVEVTTTNPKHSYILADTVARLAPYKIMEIENADAVRLIDPATMPENPSSPNKAMNMLIGIMLGLIIGTVMAIVIEYSDKRIKNEEDLKKYYNIPILGVAPKIER